VAETNLVNWNTSFWEILSLSLQQIVWSNVGAFVMVIAMLNSCFVVCAVDSNLAIFPSLEILFLGLQQNVSSVSLPRDPAVVCLLVSLLPNPPALMPSAAFFPPYAAPM
jgi:hypothetical protein